MIDIYNNVTAFISLKPRKFLLLGLSLLFILMVSFFLLSFTKISDNYPTKGYVTCDKDCILMAYLPSDIPLEEVTFNNKNYDYEVLNTEIYVPEPSIVSLKKITFKVKHKFQNNEIVNLNFYYHKQRIIVKIKDLMF